MRYRSLVIIAAIFLLSGCATGGSWQTLKGLSELPSFTTGYGRNFSTDHPASGPVVLSHVELLNYGIDEPALDENGQPLVDENGQPIKLRFRYFTTDYVIGVGASNEQAANTVRVPTGIGFRIYETFNVSANYDLNNTESWREAAMGTIGIEPLKANRSPVFKAIYDYALKPAYDFTIGRLFKPKPEPTPAPAPAGQ